MMCTHHVEQMFVFTNAFRQDYCAIPFPFVTPYYSDRYRDQCFNCFLISPDGKIVPADYADRMMFGHAVYADRWRFPLEAAGFIAAAAAYRWCRNYIAIDTDMLLVV